MDELIPYKMATPCVKCANWANHGIRYRIEFIPVKLISLFPLRFNLNEYLLRTCECCGFQWKEAVLVHEFDREDM